MKRAIVIIGVIFAVIAFIAPAASAQAPPYQIATVQGSSSLCLNRAGGGTGAGTHVIGYNCGDPNDDFEFIWLGGMCGGGYVTYKPVACPYANSAIDAQYDGAAIVELYNYHAFLCVGNSGSGATILNQCPDQYGNGGANGTIFTMSDVYDFPNYHGQATYLVNLYWTNNANSPRWLCITGYRQQLTENSSVGASGSCQFHSI